MKYILDTNVIIDLLRGKSTVNSKFFEDGAGINTITLSELFYGANKSKNKNKSLKQIEDLVSDFDLEIMDFDQKASAVFGKIKSNLESSGERLDDLDLLIASSAIVEGKTFVTNNLKHFKRIKSLSILAPN